MKVLLVSLSMVVAASAMACASDPNKEVKEARGDEIEAHRDRQEDSAERQRKQADLAAEQQRAKNDNAAAAQYAGAPASRERAEAENKLVLERREYEAKARERLQKLDARAAEAKAKIDAAGTRAKADAKKPLETVATQRAMVVSDLDRLAATSNEGWKAATQAADAKLDDLEKLTDSATKSADKILKN